MAKHKKGFLRKLRKYADPVQHFKGVKKAISSKKIKNLTRKVMGRIENIAGFAIEAAGTVWGGALGAAAGTAIAAPLENRAGRQLARSRGHGGRAARKAGRKTMKQALIVGGALTGGALVAGIASGAGAFASGISSFNAITGSGASAVATNAGATAAGNVAAQSSIPGLVTSLDVAPTAVAGTATAASAAGSIAPTAAAAASGSGGILGAINQLLGHPAAGGTNVSVGGGGLPDLGGVLSGLANQGLNTGQDYLNSLLGGQQQEKPAGGVPTWVWIAGGLAAAYFLSRAA